MKTLRFTAIIEGDDDGHYACCQELKGCQTQGDRVEEAIANLREAAELYVETLSPEEKEALAAGPKTILSTSLEVSHAYRHHV
jgi:predicted RNase H-like HicB family nuclease